MPLKERSGSTSPGDASVGNDGGAATVEYYVVPEMDGDTPTTNIQDELRDGILKLLGDTETGQVSSGGINRTPPLAHPFLQHMYAVKVESIRGQGKGERQSTGTSIDVEVPSTEDYQEYDRYLLRVRFAALPFPILRDNSIGEEEVEYYNDEGILEFSAPIAREWLRYTDVEKGKIDVDVITAQFGTMKLRGTGASANADKPFPGMPSIRQPRAALIVTHHFVPYAWYMHANNRYDIATGRVNQSEIFGYSPGKLLLHSAEARRFTPPWPKLVTSADNDLMLTNAYEKLCDIRMTFLICNREAKERITPANRNHVIDGWNSLPHIDRKYYYCTSAVAPTVAGDPEPTNGREEGVPPYKSYAMHLLWKDPR